MARALDDPDAEPEDSDEAAAVARYEALLAERARAVGRARGGKSTDGSREICPTRFASPSVDYG